MGKLTENKGAGDGNIRKARKQFSGAVEILNETMLKAIIAAVNGEDMRGPFDSPEELMKVPDA